MIYDAKLLRDSLKIIVEREPHLPRRFYDVFFKLHPDVEPLFSHARSGSRARQEHMLAQAIMLMVDRVEDRPWFEEHVDKLGEHHAKYALNDEMYDWFRDSLMVVLEEVAGDHWTVEVEAAWTAALDDISSRMKTAARRTALSKPST